MRNTPGNIVQFPESTLLFAVERILIPMEVEFDHVFYGQVDVELEPGFIYHLTNVSFECSFTEYVLSEARGFVEIAIIDRNREVAASIANIGYDLIYPAGSPYYVKSQQVDVWLWGLIQFQAGGYLPLENYRSLSCRLFLGRYRR
jgi:hypothetical protein